MKHFLFLNFANFIFHCARMISGAIFVVLLREQHISLEIIAIAKGLQLLTSSIFTLPTGMLADKYGGKPSVVLACLFSIIYYTLLLNPSSSSLIVGEICNGIALAFFTGAFENWLFSLTSEKTALNFHKFLAKSREYSYLAVIFGGLIGVFMGDYVFPISLILMCISLTIFLFIRDEKLSKNANLDRMQYLIYSLKELFSKPSGNFIALTSLLLGGCMQLIYQFWQPFFSKFSDDKTVLGWIFVSFMLTQFTFSNLFRKFILKRSDQIIPLIGICWTIGAIFLLNTIITHHFLIAIISFCLFLGLINAASNMLMAYLGESLESKFLSTIISFLDLLGKCFASVLLFFADRILTPFQFGWPFLVISLLCLTLCSFTFRKKLCLAIIN